MTSEFDVFGYVDKAVQGTDTFLKQEFKKVKREQTNVKESVEILRQTVVSLKQSLHRQLQEQGKHLQLLRGPLNACKCAGKIRAGLQAAWYATLPLREDKATTRQQETPSAEWYQTAAPLIAVSADVSSPQFAKQIQSQEGQGRADNARKRKMPDAQATTQTIGGLVGLPTEDRQKLRLKRAQLDTKELLDPLQNKFRTKRTYRFPRRRRKCKSLIEKEKREDLEAKIFRNCTDGLEIVDVANKGRGVVATKEFKRGDFVVEYAGDLISLTEAKEREATYSKDPTKGNFMYYFRFKDKPYYMDATTESGNLGRLLNHSKTLCNCHTKLVNVNNHPHLIIFASRDIKSGEELLFDYGDRDKSAIDAYPWLKT